jgi:hypothetical protein
MLRGNRYTAEYWKASSPGGSQGGIMTVASYQEEDNIKSQVQNQINHMAERQINHM